MESAPAPQRTHIFLIALALAGPAIVVAYALVPEDPDARTLLSGSSLLAANLLAAVVILGVSRRPWGWRPAQAFGLAALGAAVLAGGLVVRSLLSSDASAPTAAAVGAVALVGIGALLVIPFGWELRDHFRREHRIDVAADVALIAVAAGGIAYLALRPAPDEGMTAAAVTSSAAFALVAATVIAAWGALTLSVPSPIHLGLLVVMAVLVAGSLPLEHQWVRGTFRLGQPEIDLPLCLGALGLAALIALRPRLSAPLPFAALGRWARPALTVTGIAAASATLAAAVVVEGGQRVETVEGIALLAVLAPAIVGRILMNQLRTRTAGEDLRRALGDKESALLEADAALDKLRGANDTLASSEERLRLLFDAAVDGIVELDGNGVIRRVNEAFCRMADRPADRSVGRTWIEVAQAIEGADPSLASLPDTGQATLARQGHDLHLEARTSLLPGPDGGRLLLIRDVSAARVADQTIRSLFKFLQDRDQDRTRLLRRTNAAIEAERNRIARDLHDGPVQGISAASLSVEAVLLMLRTGDIEQGVAVLTKVRRELSEETDNLRRLMADLRPPVLEERGLFPALQEMLARFGREFGMRTSFRSRALVDVPADLETLAYRVVQEALWNAGKHSKGTCVDVSVEAVAGQLRIEVVDDGLGFDPNRARDFLRVGRVGLASMRERTELANGTFAVRSTPGSGTVVVATLPFESVAAASEPALA